MAKKEQKARTEKSANLAAKTDTVSYRLKCAKTANGLSHFVMYGDVPKKKSLL
jgi:hypothetical protein